MECQSREAYDEGAGKPWPRREQNDNRTGDACQVRSSQLVSDVGWSEKKEFYLAGWLSEVFSECSD